MLHALCKLIAHEISRVRTSMPLKARRRVHHDLSVPLEGCLFSCEWLHHIRHEYISIRIAVRARGVFSVELLALQRGFVLADMASLGLLQVSRWGREVGSKPRLRSPDSIGALCEHDTGWAG